MKTRLRLPAAVLIPFIVVPLAGQMPDWKYFRDRDGNTYFLDRAGSIRIVDNLPKRVPVTATGIDYHLRRAEEYLSDHHIVEGLQVIKSILALPDGGNQRIVDARRKATALLARVKKNQGGRLTAYEIRAGAALYGDAGRTVVENDLMRYQFAAPGLRVIVRERSRINDRYRYMGLPLAVHTSGKKGGDPEAIDALVAVDAEYFSAGVRSMNEAIARLRDNAGRDTLSREEVPGSPDLRWWRISEKNEGGIAGFEGIGWSGNYICMVRIVTGQGRFAATQSALEEIRRSFMIVSP